MQEKHESTSKTKVLFFPRDAPLVFWPITDNQSLDKPDLSLK